MAITEGVTGFAQTPANTNEQTLFRSTGQSGYPGGGHTEWAIKAGADSVEFRFYLDASTYISYSLAAGESERIGIRHGSFTQITAVGNTTSSEITWYPTVLIAGA